MEWTTRQPARRRSRACRSGDPCRGRGSAGRSRQHLNAAGAGDSPSCPGDPGGPVRRPALAGLEPMAQADLLPCWRLWAPCTALCAVWPRSPSSSLRPAACCVSVGLWRARLPASLPLIGTSMLSGHLWPWRCRSRADRLRARGAMPAHAAVTGIAAHAMPPASVAAMASVTADSYDIHPAHLLSLRFFASCGVLRADHVEGDRRGRAREGRRRDHLHRLRRNSLEEPGSGRTHRTTRTRRGCDTPSRCSGPGSSGPRGRRPACARSEHGL